MLSFGQLDTGIMSLSWMYREGFFEDVGRA